MSRLATSAARAALTALVAGLVLGGVTPSATAADGGCADIPITVGVIASDGSTAAPAGGSQPDGCPTSAPDSGSGAGGGTVSTGDSGSSAGARSSTRSGGRSSTGAGSSTAASGTDAVAAPGATKAGTSTAAQLQDGLFGVGGLSARYDWSPIPSQGSFDTSIVVRNGTKKTMDVTARFWLTGPGGIALGPAIPAAATGIAPGESRTVRVPLDGVGQWGLATAHVTVTPPKSVDGSTLVPVTRDQTVFVLPWFTLLVIIMGACAYVAVRWVLYARAAARTAEGGVAA